MFYLYKQKGAKMKLKVENGFVGKNMKINRIRRITGYLVGSLERFNNAKACEVADRVKHM